MQQQRRGLRGSSCKAAAAVRQRRTRFMFVSGCKPSGMHWPYVSRLFQWRYVSIYALGGQVMRQVVREIWHRPVTDEMQYVTQG
jgi:hypothetical protein